MLFEEALPLRGSDAVLSTLSLVQVRPGAGPGGLGSRGHGEAAKGPEACRQPEEPEASPTLLLTSLPFWGLPFPA